MDREQNGLYAIKAYVPRPKKNRSESLRPTMAQIVVNGIICVDNYTLASSYTFFVFACGSLPKNRSNETYWWHSNHKKCRPPRASLWGKKAGRKDLYAPELRRRDHCGNTMIRRSDEAVQDDPTRTRKPTPACRQKRN